MKTTLLTLVSTSVAVVAFGLACDRTPGAAAAPADAPAAAPAESKFDTNSYTLEIKPVGKYKKGEEGTFQIVLKTKPGYHVNEEYPTRFTAADAAGVKYAQAKLHKAKDGAAFAFADCSEKKDEKCTLTITVKFTPEQSGNVKVGGELNAGVCNKDSCLTEKKTLELSVPVS